MRSNSEIIDIIIYEKDKRQLSLSELARRVGVAKSALSRYFNKTRQFPLNKVEDFASALGVTSEYLLGVEPIAPTTTKQKEIFARNLQYYINKKGVSRQQLCDELNIKYTTLANWLQSETYPRIDKIEQLSNYFNIQKSDLIEDKSTMSTTQKISNVITRLNDTNKNKVLDYSNKLLHEQGRIIEEASNLYKVIAFAGLSAGKGYAYEEHEQTTVYTDRSDLKPHDFATIVHGDSMEPLYSNGDVVLISNGYDNVQGGVYAVDFNNESYLKRVYFEGNRIRLVSINPNYSDKYIYLPIDDATYLNIIGKVVDSFKPIQK